MGPNDEHRALLPQVLVRKYLAYARQYCAPVRLNVRDTADDRAMGAGGATGQDCRLTLAQVLSDEAKATIKDFYLQLRQQVGSSSTPITVRVLGWARQRHVADRDERESRCCVLNACRRRASWRAWRASPRPERAWSCGRWRRGTTRW